MKYIKSFLSLILCLAMLCCVATFNASAAVPWAGDVNGDGKVTAADTLVICKYILFPAELTPEDFAVYDINQDGVITNEDTLYALHTAVDNIPLRPVDQPFEKPTLPSPYDNGWFTIGGKKYYFVNGQALTGWQNIGGFRYKFDDSGALASKVGIDVSSWQNDINWQDVKNTGVEFAMIRVGYRGYGTAGTMREDIKFHQNIAGAKNAGIKVGVYFYSQAISNAEAVDEANFVLDRIRNMYLDYPVAYDIEKAETAAGETGRTEDAGITKSQRTDFAIAFCETIKKAGFKTQIYSNKNWLENYLDLSRLQPYDIWLAHWVATTNYSASPYTMWQYGHGNISGIQGDVDLNVCLKDYY